MKIKDLYENTKLEIENLQTELANKDIDSKLVGGTVLVDAENLKTAQKMATKLGFKSSVVKVNKG